MNLSMYQNKLLETKIKNCPPCSRIDLQKEKLVDADVEFVIEEAMMKKQCSMLWLRENKMSSNGISMIISALNDNTTLEGLSLCNNNITDDDVVLLTEQLSENKCQLNRLSLTSNEITDQGAEYLAEMLKTNRTLSQLWLGFNQMSDHGVKQLMNSLANHNRTLHVLSLAWNDGITDVSVDLIVDMLECNDRLKTLCLSHCNLSDMGKSKLRIAAKSRWEFYIDL